MTSIEALGLTIIISMVYSQGAERRVYTRREEGRRRAKTDNIPKTLYTAKASLRTTADVL
jgi:hypothetical protein